MRMRRIWVSVSSSTSWQRKILELTFSIALLTISHRPALFKYHQFLLRLTGDHGQWTMEQIGTQQQQQSLEKEMQSLEAKLQSVESLKSRLGEIDAELSLKNI